MINFDANSDARVASDHIRSDHRRLVASSSSRKKPRLRGGTVFDRFVYASSPSYSRGFRFALTGMAQGIELA